MESSPALPSSSSSVASSSSSSMSIMAQPPPHPFVPLLWVSAALSFLGDQAHHLAAAVAGTGGRQQGNHRTNDVEQSNNSNKSHKDEPEIEQDRQHAGATIEGNDLSLFYGDQQQLTTITPSRRYLPNDVYGSLVRDAVVCCVDIVLVRKRPIKNDNHQWVKEALLVLRQSEPAKGLWWWPGGRLLKGETFFDAAIRKAHEETGIANVNPIQILGVWNTFFPTSAWDTETSQGTQTVNPIVLVEIDSTETPASHVQLDEQSSQYKWVSLDPELAINEDAYVQQALLRLRSWNPHYLHSS